MTRDERTENSGKTDRIQGTDQDVSTQELVDNGYEVDLEIDSTSSPDPERQQEHHQRRGHDFDYLRKQYEESINASSEENPRSDGGYELDTGPERTAATYVGDPDLDPTEYNDWWQRVNDSRDPYSGNQSEESLSDRQREWDKKRVAQAICSQIPITKRQREKVVRAMDAVDFDQFGQQHAYERVCLGLIAVIVDKEREEHVETWDELASQEDEFKQIAKSLDVNLSDLSTIKQIARRELAGETLEPVTAGVRRDTNIPKRPLSEKPDEYWEEQPAEKWVVIARYWDRQTEEFKDALPDEKRELIRQLQTWEPWEAFDDPTFQFVEKNESELSATRTMEQDPEQSESSTAVETRTEVTDEEIEEEAAKLVAEMERAAADEE
jgi:hypothetical protein